LVSDDF
jgi:hypothetical protein